MDEPCAPIDDTPGEVSNLAVVSVDAARTGGGVGVAVWSRYPRPQTGLLDADD